MKELEAVGSQIVVPDESRDIAVVKNVRIPVRDGVQLAADFYVPRQVTELETTEARLPVVMEYTPYRKDEVVATDSWYDRLPRHGYIVARVDIRGTGGSGGTTTDEYTALEQSDGYDAIEWLAAQPWCDGHVNMIGISYGGFTCLQVATRNPPHLSSIVPIYFTDDRYTDDCHYRGGLLRMYYDAGAYGNEMVVSNAMPPYPEWAGGEWAALWENHLERSEPYIMKWMAHQTNDSYWRHGSVRDCPELIKCPVFMIGGWRDGYPNPPLRLYESLHVPKKLLIGPWNHDLPDVAIPGPRIDYLHEVLRWLDFWCKEEQTGITDEPPVTIFVQRCSEPKPDRLDTAGHWRAESEWPLKHGAELTLYLADGDRLPEAPQGEPGQDPLVYHPGVGVMGGLWSGGIPLGLPGDQRPDEAYSLVYTTPPLQKDVTVIGRPRAVLHVSSSASVIGFRATLSDVAPDGTSHLVASGMLNATRRDSLVDPKPLVPGQLYRLAVEIDATAWCFVRGNRIRLSIANADFPNVWPTPETALSHVTFGGTDPSYLELPVVPSEGTADPPEFRPSPCSVMHQSERPDPPRWEARHDLLTGKRTVHLFSEWDQRIDTRTVLEFERLIECQVLPDEPARASARGEYTRRIIRPNWTVEGHSNLSIQGTRTHFHITIDLEVGINGSRHYGRRWVRSVTRNLL